MTTCGRKCANHSTYSSPPHTRYAVLPSRPCPVRVDRHWRLGWPRRAGSRRADSLIVVSYSVGQPSLAQSTWLARGGADGLLDRDCNPLTCYHRPKKNGGGRQHFWMPSQFYITSSTSRPLRLSFPSLLIITQDTQKQNNQTKHTQPPFFQYPTFELYLIPASRKSAQHVFHRQQGQGRSPLRQEARAARGHLRPSLQPRCQRRRPSHRL
ncbi:hypothetical protein LX32DRAFT_281659 [Colletotrichum zoysiae]|uniref:Uncharacterized protein n=1 Tax=Colletotrichum zoysiae TaxID=1216348 RepID=A0AAD9LUJ8_9PEZI|nr:hypothetical protein LX32DRAFT_281659 [Colletotrichum zoysiae]